MSNKGWYSTLYVRVCETVKNINEKSKTLILTRRVCPPNHCPTLCLHPLKVQSSKLLCTALPGWHTHTCTYNRGIFPAYARVWVIMGLHTFDPLSGLVTNSQLILETRVSYGNEPTLIHYKSNPSPKIAIRTTRARNKIVSCLTLIACHIVVQSDNRQNPNRRQQHTI